MKPDNPLSRQHYEDGCAYQVMRDCRRRCRQELEETCRLGVPVMREPNGGGHHHAEEFDETVLFAASGAVCWMTCRPAETEEE